MYNHVKEGYKCPICIAIQGIENEETMIKQDDIIYKDEVVMGIINSKFVANNPGHAIIVPLIHYEHIYDLPEKETQHIMLVAKKIAIAMKKIRNCDGIMILQNNEPASGQHAFHYHLHIFPRFINDHFTENVSKVRVSQPEERKPYSSAMKAYLLN